jgi:hypothetical protein
MANKKSANNNNKLDEYSKGSPGKTSLASDGVIIPSPKGSRADEFPPSEITSEKLLQLASALSLKEKFTFLEHFDLIPKLGGRSPFSPDELEEIKRERLRTNLIDESRFGKGDFFPVDVVGDPPNDDHRNRDIVSPLDGIGFRPSKNNFLPRGEHGDISSSFPGDGLSPYQPDPNAGNSSKHVQFGESNATSFRAYSPTTSTTQSKSDPTSTVNMSKQTSASSPKRGISQGPSNTFVNNGNQHHHHLADSTQTYYTHSPHIHSQPYNHPIFNPQTYQPPQQNQSGSHPHFTAQPHQPHPINPTGGAYYSGFQQQPPQHPHYPTGTAQHNMPPQPTQHASTMNRMPQGTPHGFMLRTVARAGAQADYDNDRIIISKNQRGSTTKERAKIRELCTTAITPQIARSNITKLLCNDSASYDIAEDASQWQTTLRSINRHAIASDFKHIVMIPLIFDENDPSTLTASTTYVNAILDHDQLTDEHYKSFQ